MYCAASTTMLAILYFTLILHSAPRVVGVRFTRALTSNDSLSPPVAKKEEHVMELLGDTRIDNYYWLRDDSRSNASVLAYLREENEYAEFVMSEMSQFQDQLFSEIKGRVKEDDVSLPTRRGNYYYYSKTLVGKEYPQYCRRLVPDANSPPSVNDTMPTGPNDPPEVIILDVNVMAQNHSYYSLGAFKASPNNKLIAYAEDTKGNAVYTAFVIDAETQTLVGNPLNGLTSVIYWVGDDTIVYITVDEILRPAKVWLHKLGDEQANDTLLYDEKDDTYSLSVSISEDKEFLFVATQSKITKYVFYLNLSRLDSGLQPLTPRVIGTDTSVTHRGNYFFIRRRNDDVFNSELLACPVDNVTATTILMSHRKSVKIQDIKLFRDYIILFEREAGLSKITIYRLPAVGEPLESLENGRAVELSDPTYSLSLSESQFDSSIMRFWYSSMRVPTTVYDYDMNTGISVAKRTEIIVGGYNASDYVSEWKMANASDGTQVPISIVYRKNLAKLDGSDPLLLYGYGAYESSVDPGFSSTRLSLLNRGFIYANAHVRGGGEMGRQWYEDGRLLRKRNTFTDFITCAEYLIANNYTSNEKLSIDGRSAGGLLVGAVVNMRPDLFKVVLAEYPFLDILTTMLDPTIPLTTSEWEEWGDPRMQEYYFYMKSYSPVDNVMAQNYPHMLVTSGLFDSSVIYSEPAKFVAKLRDVKTDNNMLIFKCELDSGHFSDSGRSQGYRESALKYAFIIKALNMIPPMGSQPN